LANINVVTYEDLEQLWEAAEPILARLDTLQEAAQRFTELIFETFQQSAVLVRFFATVDFNRLPENERQIAQSVATDKGYTQALGPQTSVLSLLGTTGIEREWCDRRLSRGHLAIPLVTPELVRSIPMIARLLSEIGVNLQEGRLERSEFVMPGPGNLNGIFYVPDARTALDEQGRRIISSVDFVEQYGIRSVIGFGGDYLWKNNYLAVVLFSRDRVERSEAFKFVPLTSSLKIATARFVRKNNIYNKS
jgi:hypothetical protein